MKKVMFQLSFAVILASIAFTCLAGEKLKETGTFPDPSKFHNLDDEVSTNLVRLAKAYADLLDNGKLPGLKSDEHGNAFGYPLSVAERKRWLKDGYIDKQMMHDIAKYEVPYILAVKTTAEKRLNYFFLIKRNKIDLIAAYMVEGEKWVRIDGGTTQKG